MTARSPTMVTLHDTRFVERRWWNDGWTVKTVRHLTVVGLRDTGPCSSAPVPAPVVVTLLFPHVTAELVEDVNEAQLGRETFNGCHGETHSLVGSFVMLLMSWIDC